MFRIEVDSILTGFEDTSTNSVSLNSVSFISSKAIRLFISLIFSIFLINSLVLFESRADEQKFLAVKMLMQEKGCFSCHAGWSSLTEQGWVNSGLIIPKNMKDSPITLRIKFGSTDNILSAEDMPRPKGGAVWNSFSMDDYYKFRDWITSLELSSDGGGGGGDPQIGDVYHSSDEKIRIGDRFFVKSVLESIYGPEISDITDKYILKKISFFGGACDYKEHFTYMNGTTRTSDYMACKGVDLSDDKASLIPSSSTLREGLRIKACHEINVRDARLTALAQKIGATTSTWPSVANIAALYKLFYVGRNIPGKVEHSLVTLVEGAKKEFPGRSLEGWRYLSLTLCSSPDWQQP